MKIVKAIKALKRGQSVTRRMWCGNSYLYLVPENRFLASCGVMMKRLDYDTKLPVQDDTYWLSPQDTFAEDWEVMS